MKMKIKKFEFHDHSRSCLPSFIYARTCLSARYQEYDLVSSYEHVIYDEQIFVRCYAPPPPHPPTLPLLWEDGGTWDVGGR